MSGSGIITRGYGQSQSTIITRGYGDLARLIEDAITEVIPTARRLAGATTPKWTYDPTQKEVDQFTEICVDVALTEFAGEIVDSPIRAKVCKKFANVGISVSANDVTIIHTDRNSLRVEVRLQPVQKRTIYHVSASVTS